jgi:hypothetical protein
MPGPVWRRAPSLAAADRLSARYNPPHTAVKYFYDHQTDAVSLMLTDDFDYSSSEEVAPGVMLYLDRRNRAIALEIRGAGKILDTKGLIPLYARTITQEELERRMLATPAGRMAWITVQPRLS